MWSSSQLRQLDRLGGQRGKPHRLLHSNGNAKARRIAARNKTQSPLLRLPGEIRNRIFSLVLGGNYIHLVPVTPNDSCHASHIICQSGNTSFALREQGGDDSMASEANLAAISHNEYWCLSLRDSEGATVQLDLSLLQVCRQTHGEPALIPFESNAFIISDAEEVGSATARLLVQQRQAIKSLILWVHVDQDDTEDDFAFSKTERAAIMRLTGLSRLRVGIYLWYHPPEEAVKGVFNSVRQAFEQHRLQEGTVKISDRKWWGQDDIGLPQEYYAWAKETEAALRKA